jgi:hypothetical protein
MVMLNQKKLTVAIAIAVGASAAAIGSASAGQLFFPQAVVSDTVTTVVSVINTKEATDPRVAETLHYRYYYKVYDPAIFADEHEFNEYYCEETNRYLPTSKYDIQTIDLAGAITEPDAQGVMFNDPSVNNQWEGRGDYAMARTVGKPHRGYLVVEHSEDMNVSDAGLYGEAVVFEFGSGAAWGYQGFWKDGGEGDACDFSRASSNSPSHVAIFPFDADTVSTRFQVTPLYDTDGVPDVCPDDMNDNSAYIELEADYGNNVVMFDRDENPFSGAKKKEIVCVGSVLASELVTEGTVASVADGGWTGVVNYAKIERPDGSTYEIEPAALIFKLEFGLTEDISGGAPGIYNNAFYLHPAFQWGGQVSSKGDS